MDIVKKNLKATKLAWFRAMILLTLLINGALVAVGVLFFRHEVPDSQTYLDFSRGLIKDGAFYWGDELGLFRTPGYPLLIKFVNSFFQNAIIGTILIQACISICIAVILYKILNLCGYFKIKNIPLKWLVIMLINVALLLDATYFFATFSVLSESFFTLLIMASCLLVLSLKPLRSNRFALLSLGFILGFAALTKPIGQFLFVSFGIYLFTKRKLLKPTGGVLFILGFCLATAPWLYRNTIIYKYSGLSCVGPINLVYYRSAAILAEKEGRPIDEVKRQLEKTFPSCKMSDDQAKEMKDYSIQTFRDNFYLSFRQLLRASSMFFFDPGGSYVAQGLSLSPRDSGILSRIMVNGLGELGPYMLSLNGRTLAVLGWSALYLGIQYLGALYLLISSWQLRLSFEHEKLLEFFYLMLLIALPIVGLSLGPETTARFRAPLIPFLTFMVMSLTSSYFQRLDSVLSASEGIPAQQDKQVV